MYNQARWWWLGSFLGRSLGLMPWFYPCGMGSIQKMGWWDPMVCVQVVEVIKGCAWGSGRKSSCQSFPTYLDADIPGCVFPGHVLPFRFHGNIMLPPCFTKRGSAHDHLVFRAEVAWVESWYIDTVKLNCNSIFASLIYLEILAVSNQTLLRICGNTVVAKWRRRHFQLTRFRWRQTWLLDAPIIQQ